MSWQDEFHIEAIQIPALRFLNGFHLVRMYHHTTAGMLHMRQGPKALRPGTALLDFFRRHLAQLLPGETLRQFHPDTLLDALATSGHFRIDAAVAQIIALLQQLLMAADDLIVLIEILLTHFFERWHHATGT
jgi:hypothetical protein